MKYLDDLKKTVIDECIFKYVDSDNGSYAKEMDVYLNDFSYTGFNDSAAMKVEDIEYGSLIQKQFVLFDGRGQQITDELMNGLPIADSQSIMTFLSYCFFELVKKDSTIKVQNISTSSDLSTELNELSKYELEDAVMLLDIKNLLELTRNQLSGSVKAHERKGIFYKNTFDFNFPVIYCPRLGLKEILIFNKNYSFCYSDLELVIEGTKLKVNVKIALQRPEYAKLLRF